MASYMLIKHRVRDYTTWKHVYDAHLQKREEAGLTEKFVLKGADDPHEVITLHEAKDLYYARSFIESKALQDVMRHAGVEGAPEVYFMDG